MKRQPRCAEGQVGLVKGHNCNKHPQLDQLFIQLMGRDNSVNFVVVMKGCNLDWR